MAPPAGRQTAGRDAKNKGKGEESMLEKYVKGGEEVWSKGLKKILLEILRRDMKEEMEKMNDR